MVGFRRFCLLVMLVTIRRYNLKNRTSILRAISLSLGITYKHVKIERLTLLFQQFLNAFFPIEAKKSDLH